MAKGIILTPQVVDPIAAHSPTAHGLWINTAEELMHTKAGEAPANISQFITNGVAAISDTIQNLSGSMIPVNYPVAISTLGGIELIDPSVEASALAIAGLTTAAINSGDSGAVMNHGTIYNITTSFAYRDVVYVSKAGGLTNVKPSVGVGGFVAGDFSIRLGVIKKNVTNPLWKDLLIGINVLGQIS